MVKKLALSYSDPENPGTDDQSRGLAALIKYNSGGWVIPEKYKANVSNYLGGLDWADAALKGLVDLGD